MTVLSKMVPRAAAGSILVGVLVLMERLRHRSEHLDDAGEERRQQGEQQQQQQQQQQRQSKRKKRGSSAMSMLDPRLRKLLGIMVPGWTSAEMGFACFMAVLLLARSTIDLRMLTLTTEIDGAIVARKAGLFRKGLEAFLIQMVPVSVVNALLKYVQSELALRMRRRLTRHLHEEYFRHRAFYSVCNIDTRLQNPEMVLTDDIQKLSDSTVEMFSSTLKPVLDIVLYTSKLTHSGGMLAPLAMIAYLLTSGVVLTACRKPTSNFTAAAQKQEGRFRYLNSRLTASAEEIAFYGGEHKEHGVLRASFDKLLRVLRWAEQFRFSIGVLDGVVAKYLATVVGWFVVARPFFDMADPSLAGFDREQLFQEYGVRAKQLMRLSSALGALVLCGREMANTVAYAQRVVTLDEVFRDVQAGRFRRKQCDTDVGADASANASTAAGAEAADTGDAENSRGPGEHKDNGFLTGNGPLPPGHDDELDLLTTDESVAATPSATGSTVLGTTSTSSSPPRPPAPAAGAGAGPPAAAAKAAPSTTTTTSTAAFAFGCKEECRNAVTIDEQGTLIRFEDVPLVTPTGDVLVEALSFEVHAGQNTVVSGPNGCGKSSLFRILGSLWPAVGGHVTKPPADRLFYVPQRPYLPLGTFRDQIIYPWDAHEMRARGKTDDDLMELLRVVELEPLVDRVGGWDAHKAEWGDVLSGGEKQRVAMARLFLHRPSFAILDECTSAVSVEVEANIYRYARQVGITLFTVSHRKSIFQHHEFILRFDGRGGYEFRKLEDGEHAKFGS